MAFSGFVGIHYCFNDQSAGQELREAQGCWLLGQGFRSQGIYKAFKSLDLS